MDKIRIGVDMPIWVWLNDLMIAISYLVCFGSLMVSLWLLFAGQPVAWMAPVVFGIFTALFGVQMRPYPSTKETMQGLVHHASDEKDKS